MAQQQQRSSPRPIGWLLLVLGIVASLSQHLCAAQVACPQGKPPMFYLPGIMGSNLLVTRQSAAVASQPPFTEQQLQAVAAAAEVSDPAAMIASMLADDSPFAASAIISSAAASGPEQLNKCPIQNLNTTSIWPPLNAIFLTYPDCRNGMFKLKFNRQSKRFTNGTTMSVWANDGGATGTNFTMFKGSGDESLVTTISARLGYTLGRDLFALPYDFRQAVAGMPGSGELQRLADKIEAAVAANCGKKAILIGHSMGALVSLELLRNPKFEAWRQRNVQGFVAVAPPFGGAAFPLDWRISGAFSNPGFRLPSPLNLLPEAIIYGYSYQLAFGLPSVVMLMPYAQAFGKSWTAVVTPKANYTVSQFRKLLLDIGDTEAVAFFDKVRTLGSLAAASGPIPGITTYCIYGTQIDTVKTYKYNTDIIANKQGPKATALVMGKGDGTVNLESLRLCRKLTSKRNQVVELGGGIDHGTVVNSTLGHNAIVTALTQMISAT